MSDIYIGYIRLAEHILKAQMDSYRMSLSMYAKTRKEKYLKEAKCIEIQLRSDYYSILALGLVDFEEIIAEERRKYGLDKE